MVNFILPYPILGHSKGSRVHPNKQNSLLSIAIAMYEALVRLAGVGEGVVDMGDWGGVLNLQQLAALMLLYA